MSDHKALWEFRNEEMICEVLEDATKKGSLSERNRAARALACFRQNYCKANVDRDRSRSPRSREALQKGDSVVREELLSGSTGSIAPDSDLDFHQRWQNRGGIRQRMARNLEYEQVKHKAKLAEQLRDAAQHGSKRLVKEILDEISAQGFIQAQVLNRRTVHDDHSALWHAVAAGNYEIAALLLSAGASPHVEQSPEQQLTAFQLAQKQVDRVPTREKKHWKAIVTQMERCSATQNLATCGA
jgi:hypothetical protein